MASGFDQLTTGPAKQPETKGAQEEKEIEKNKVEAKQRVDNSEQQARASNTILQAAQASENTPTAEKAKEKEKDAKKAAEEVKDKANPTTQAPSGSSNAVTPAEFDTQRLEESKIFGGGNGSGKNTSKGTEFTSLNAGDLVGEDTATKKMDSLLTEESGREHYIKSNETGDKVSIVSIDKEAPDKEKTKTELTEKGYKELTEEDVSKFKEKDDTAIENKANVVSGGTADQGVSEEQPEAAVENRGPTYNEKVEQLKKEKAEPKKYDDKGLLEIVPGHSVKYHKVTGNNKIKFPIYDKIMGLPPMKIFEDERNNTTDLFNVNTIPDDGLNLKEAKEYFLYNIDEQLNNSFPILIIHPLDNEYLYGLDGKIRSEEEFNKRRAKAGYNIINEVTYKFAVATSNNITYNHQNDYAPGSIESGVLKSFDNMGSFAREAVNLGQVTAGMSANNAFSKFSAWGLHAGGTLDEGVSNMRKAAEGAMTEDKTLKDIGTAFLDGLSLAQSVLGGGRIDFPDFWQDSKTNFQQQFSIELRTLNPDPNSDQYFYELLLPLYILLTLSLPTEGNVFSYKTPPLITCSLDNSFMEIKLGAITNISWSFDMKEINFKKVPYHCKVDLTIRDLYSVMSQMSYKTNNDKYVDSHNTDITTKDEYIRRFVRTKDMKVPNEKYYLTEFAKIPAYLAALEKMQADEAKAAEDAKKDSTANGSGAVTKGDTGKVNHDGKKSGAETGTAEKSAEIKTDPKTGKKSLVQSIGGFVTSVTKNIKNVIADVNKAIQPVRKLINTGMVVLGTGLNLKTSIKMMGETANLTGILNGSFAASTRLAFDNLGKAGNVLSKLSGGALGPAMKSVGTICNTLSDIGRSALTLDLPSCVGKDGKTVSLKDQINVASSTVGATLGMVRNIANTVQAAKQIGAITKSSDPLATLNTYLGAANSIIDDIDFTDRLLNATKGSAIATGQYTAGQLSSDASLQAKFEYVAQRVAENARLVNSTMFNTTFMEYMVQQDWFDKYFTLLRTPTETSPVSIADFAYKTEKGKAITVKGVSDSGLSVSEATGLSQEELTKSMGHIDSALNKFADGVGKEFSANCKDITIQSASSGLANVADVPVTVVITSNLPNSNPTAGGTVTIG